MKQGAIIRIYCNFALYTHVLNETRIKKQITKMKKNLFILALLLCITLGASAQKKFNLYAVRFSPVHRLPEES